MARFALQMFFGDDAFGRIKNGLSSAFAGVTLFSETMAAAGDAALSCADLDPGRGGKAYELRSTVFTPPPSPPIHFGASSMGATPSIYQCCPFSPRALPINAPIGPTEPIKCGGPIQLPPPNVVPVPVLLTDSVSVKMLSGETRTFVPLTPLASTLRQPSVPASNIADVIFKPTYGGKVPDQSVIVPG